MNISTILQITSTSLVILAYLFYIIKKIIEKSKIAKTKKMAKLKAFQEEQKIKNELYKEYLKSKKGE